MHKVSGTSLILNRTHDTVRKEEGKRRQLLEGLYTATQRRYHLVPIRNIAFFLIKTKKIQGIKKDDLYPRFFHTLAYPQISFLLYRRVSAPPQPHTRGNVFFKSADP